MGGRRWVIAAVGILGMGVSVAMGQAPAVAPAGMPAAASVTPASTAGVPTWAAEARWYQVPIARFRDGDPANNPPGAQPWAVNVAPPAAAQTPAAPTSAAAGVFGGDLQGLRQKLPYLKDLGINALCLTPIFAAGTPEGEGTIDYRHVADALGVAGTLAQMTGETLDLKTWVVSAGDRVFLDLLKEAHEQGFHVVVEVAFDHVGEQFWAWQDVVKQGAKSPYAGWFEAGAADTAPPQTAGGAPAARRVKFRCTPEGLAPEVERHLLDVSRRWLDPDGDGNPRDGVDGWRVRGHEQVAHAFWKRWRTHVKQINPDALLIVDVEGDPTAWLTGDEFDAACNYEVGWAVVKFFAGHDSQYNLAKLLDDLGRLRGRQTPATNVALLNCLTTPGGPRLLAQVMPPAAAAPKTAGEAQPAARVLTELDVARARLALTFLHFYVGTPLAEYGDEVGMFSEQDAACRGPMWWTDLSAPESKAAGYRGDFYGLLRLLHEVRAVHEPLRRGDFRTVLLDEEHKVLAFSRSIPGQEVVLLLNYGTASQRVSVPAGKPGQVAFILTPQLVEPRRTAPSLEQPAKLSASTKVPLLQHGRARQIVDADGKVTVVVKPLAARVILLREQ
ncbi:MAG TPA: alpha-amylase family glycosyl hydrolase [Phycisphaerae bacterium]|nr:alpha-amylase family glycosyl hydrolase [Phycisphaerae bacterium]HNU45771.1 alpha-amylase family glycosyl hydrolase [Phycisphaerae bacterium]